MSNLFIPDFGDSNDANVRAKYGYLEAVISIIGNILLFFVKFILGVLINSIGLIADSVHSLSDVSSSIVLILGFRVAKKPADKQHPFGHGRSEYIATLVIAVLLIITGFGFIQQAAERILTPTSLAFQEYSYIIVAIIIGTAVAKELMARYSSLLGKKIQSETLKADAWHHRSDAITSIIVVTGILASRFGFPIIDPIAGIFVSCFIIYIGAKLIHTSSDTLIGKAPDNELLLDIKKIVTTTSGITGVHKIYVHDYGTNKVITLHAEVDASLSIEEAHAIADDVERTIKKEYKYSTFIHIEPKETCSDTKKIDILENFLRKQQDILSYHNVKIIQSKDKDVINLHLLVDKHMSIQHSHDLQEKLEIFYTKNCGPCEINIHFDPANKQRRYQTSKGI